MFRISASVVVAQITKLPIPTPKGRVSNPVIGNFLNIKLPFITHKKADGEKWPGNARFITSPLNDYFSMVTAS